MGACCGKPDRKNQGYVLGGASNTSSNASTPHANPATAGKAKATPAHQKTGGNSLGGSSSPQPPGELSASALAAQKRAEAAEKRGVQQGGGKLAKKLADQNKQSPFAVEEPVPEPMNVSEKRSKSNFFNLESQNQIMSTTRAFMNVAALARPSVRFASTLRSTQTITSITRATRIVQHQQSHQQFQFQQGRAYSTADPSFSPLARTVVTTTRVIRNVLIFSITSASLVYFTWSGTHAYLEQYKCPSPKGVPSIVRNCLHGAWVREEISPDPDVAEVYFQKAIEYTRKDLETYYKNKSKNNNIDALEIEKDKALVEIQHRLARFYGRIGQDERAATIWTRLWKLSEKESPYVTESSSSSSGFGSLFGSPAERLLITKQDGIHFAKQAAGCWMRLGEYGLAEEALSWTLSNITSPTTSSEERESSTAIEQVGLLSTLGALYVRQSKFDYALSLLVKALQTVQEHRARTYKEDNNDGKDTEGNKDDDMWYCREAILTNSIGETLYGAATASSSRSKHITSEKQEPADQNKSSWKFWSSSSKESAKKSSTVVVAAKTPEQRKKEEEALGWMQKAITMAQERSGSHRDCDECAALGLNNLGLISEMQGNPEVALEQFTEAVLYATKANDYLGLENYKRNVTRLTDKIASASESAGPSTSSLPSSLIPTNTTSSSPSASS
ncbi:hypothetical protein BGX27_001131 [Mortierella sp. AM989]|nr:hypothetical protein BGX27_001131 [Mortierella sp. AM989]